jgi:hypothetical protein
MSQLGQSRNQSIQDLFDPINLSGQRLSGDQIVGRERGHSVGPHIFTQRFEQGQS